ncbi:MAG: type II secretion system protein [Deltaproteobacteria bacterium]|nr:type II secretion system protein [Deltaproteobacteria bacterium]
MTARTRSRDLQAGITLMEVMVAVAVLGILVKLALPTLAGGAHKVNGDSEVAAFMGEIRLRQAQFQLEHGRYLSTGSDETHKFPATRAMQPQALGALPATWTQLRLQPPGEGLRCSYVAIAGAAESTPGATATGAFGFVKPKGAWYYVLAHCDLDGDSSLDSYYFTSSTDAAIKKLNPGR